MCLKNINATMQLFENVVGEKENRKFIKPFDSLIVDRNLDGALVIKNIFLVVDINLIESKNSSDDSKSQNVINNNGKLKLMIQFINNKNGGLSIPLIEYEYDFSDSSEDHNKILCHNGVKYYYQKRILNIEQIFLPTDWGFEDYSFELLIKRESPIYKDKDWVLQTFCELEITEAEKEKVIISSEIE